MRLIATVADRLHLSSGRRRRSGPVDRGLDEHRGARGRPPGHRSPSLLSPRSVAGQVLIMVLALVALLIAAAVAALVVQARRLESESARERVLAVGETFANSPGIVRALDGPHPTAVLQPRAQAARKRAGVDNIVVSTPQGIRITHRNPYFIGRHVYGPYKKAANGTAFTKTSVSPLGLTVNAVVPIFRPNGSVAGLVFPEIKVKNVNKTVTRQLPMLFGTSGAALGLAAVGSVLVGRRLRRQTRGLRPAEMTRMYEHHDAVLHAVREGVLILDDDRLLLANDEARHLLNLPQDAEQRAVPELGLDPGIDELLASRRVATDEVHPAGDRLLAVNVRSTAPYGEPSSRVVTLRDTTDLRALAGRAEVAWERLKLLYDAGGRVGTTLDVGRTAEELAKVAVPRFADFVTIELADPVLRGEEPTGGTTEMRRTAFCGIREDPPLFPVHQLIRFLPATPQSEALRRGRAVLEPDLSAAPHWQAIDPERSRRVLDFGIHSLVSVPLQARGVILGIADFWRSERAAFEEDDLSFAEELAARAALALDNARRYTREHAMAVTLQRSLLPHGLPEQSAVEAAHRYLPAQAGVGGDWFDVIPLSGARVALVVGDVVGHGLHAAATMGRLRTAVHNFSALDLSPDELLGHLDELVAQVDSAAEDEDPAVTGATCLYAIYDPVTGRITAARAGHPGPALIDPGGTVSFLDVPVGLPLGLGANLPFETAEFDVPAGSRLVLYTNGLVQNRDLDLDTGLHLLRAGLAGTADRTPEATCRAVFENLLPERPSDDIALLVARTRLLDPSQVAEWDVPSEPAAVAPIRAACTRRLEAWGLAELGYPTELILSELITNAIRYGTQPIRVRLLHDRTLICEVSDGSSTSPHLRRARSTDEGGRGLFLVAQFAERWGTRYTARGKVIWTEQSLHDGAGAAGPALGEALLDLFDDDL
ncbi:GAF domain-containing protein [Streptomyces sp. TM32]|nr:GAF domain-containing protein [Streptomyces sp. TM32]